MTTLNQYRKTSPGFQYLIKSTYAHLYQIIHGVEELLVVDSEPLRLTIRRRRPFDAAKTISN